MKDIILMIAGTRDLLNIGNMTECMVDYGSGFSGTTNIRDSSIGY